MAHADPDTGAPETSLYRITYLSTSLAEMSDAELDAILEVSRAWNQSVGITDLLLYHDGNFMQTLEGAKADVAPVFDKIRSDRRHHGLIRMEARDVGARRFRGWSMAFRRTDQLSGTQKQDFIGITEVRAQVLGDAGPADETMTFIDSFFSSFRDLS